VRHDVWVASGAGWHVALAAVVLLVAGGCGDASPESPPTGVDELVIPTPSPDPDDFVSGVDNPWFPLPGGGSWTYRTTGAPGGTASGTVTVTVRSRREPVAGIETTALERSQPGEETSVDYFAQDRSGNVWWFGREGEWRAGVDDAQAGLMMPAHPRLGDGWRTAYLPGVVDVRASVVSLDQTVTTPAGEYDALVALDTSSPLSPGEVTRSFYARGVGLVEQASVEGPVDLLQLESGP
jgi:hypothetical protein